MDVKTYRLGDLIEELDRRNADLAYSYKDVRGVTNAKGIIRTKASISGRTLERFYVIRPGEFVFNRRVHDKLGLGFNDSESTYIFTEDYAAFRVKDISVLMPEFLYLFFCRSEFDRSILYNAWGSATLFFNYEDMARVEIPVPSIAEQREVVEAWQGLRTLKEQNEQLAAPLLALCRSYLQELKKTWPMVEIGQYIHQRNEINRDGLYGEDEARGVNTNKEIQNCKRMGENLAGYKVVHPCDIVFNANIKLTKETTKFAVAMHSGTANVIVTNFYTVFYVDIAKLIPEYLLLHLMKDEFARYVKFMSCSSVRDRFDYSELEHVKIPLPPLGIQQAVVDLYRCANEAKKIAAEADAKSREICPALMQWVVKKEGRDGESTEDRSARTCPTGEVPQTHRQRHSRFFCSNGSFKIRK